MKDGDTTFILLNWQRFSTLPKVLSQIISLRWVRSIIIVDNSREIHGTALDVVTRIDERIAVVDPGSNMGPFGRWDAAMRFASTEWIATQDDDMLVRNWETIREVAMASPGRFVHALDPGHMEHDRAEYRLVGWGAMIPRDWVRPAFYEYEKRFGVDPLLLSKADRILTALMRKPSHPIAADVEVLPSARGKMAMYRQSDHARLVKEAMTRVREMLK